MKIYRGIYAEVGRFPTNMDEVPIDWEGLGMFWHKDKRSALGVNYIREWDEDNNSGDTPVYFLLHAHVDDRWVENEFETNEVIRLKEGAPVRVSEVWAMHVTKEGGVRWKLDDSSASVVTGRKDINTPQMKDGPFTGDEDGYVYHSTNPDFLNSIRKYGLPGSPDEPSDWDPDKEISPRQVYTLFVSESFSGAWGDVHLRFPASVVQSLTDRDGSELTQDVKALDLGTTDAWRLQCEEQFHIPPGAIQVLRDGEWVTLWVPFVEGVTVEQES